MWGSGREHSAGDEPCDGTIPQEHRSGEVPDRGPELLRGGSRGLKQDSWPGASGKGSSVKYWASWPLLWGSLDALVVVRYQG